MQENAGVVIMIIRIAADVLSPFNDETTFSELTGETFSQNSTGKARADNQEIKLHRTNETQPASKESTSPISMPPTIVTIIGRN